MREQLQVERTLESIEKGVQSKEAEINTMMEVTKGKCQKQLREMISSEIIRCAGELLWCGAYVEKLHCDQHVNVYTGSHWELVEHQQLKDFVNRCSERCGLPVSMLKDPCFMKPLYEALAFNLAKHRRQIVPDDEVWVNLLNGTLIVCEDGTVELREHRKEDLFNYTLSYAYDPSAQCEQWLTFLNRVLPDAGSQTLLAEYIGYCLMKSHALEKMLLLFGSGQNGKSVTLEVIEALLGTMNVSYLSLSDLTNDDVKRAGFEHKMLNISHESGKDVNPNVLKQLTSGERVTVKNLYKDPYQTNDFGKLISSFNFLPKAENSFGFFRRLIILPYDVTIPKEEVDRGLTSKLKTELPGILNWVLSALPALMNRGQFTTSECSERAIEHYRLQSDSVRLFVNETCETSDYTTKALEVYNTYRNYCLSSSLKPLGKQKFYERLESLGYARTMNTNVAYFKIKIIEQ